MHIFWIDPIKCDPPHVVTHPNRVAELCQSIREKGWDGWPLTGYFDDGRITLLSGTHRHAAASRLGIKLPIEVFTVEAVTEAFGDLEKWKEIMTPVVSVMRKFPKLDKRPWGVVR